MIETTPKMSMDTRSLCGLVPWLLMLSLLQLACDQAPPAPEQHHESDGWAVTAWGQRFEVFPEGDAFVAGQSASAHVHVTRLDGFAPLADGSVEIVLTGAGGEQVFAVEQPARPGVFNIEVLPASVGEFDMAFRIHSSGMEEIPGGRVRVGSLEEPGGLIVAPAPKGATDGGEPTDFLKEEQWRSDFATSWVRSGKLARSVGGLARLRPPAGGEAVLSTPVDGVLQRRAASWPFAGQKVKAGQVLFAVAPRIAAERSLAALEGEAAALNADLEAAQTRLVRLTELLELAATSQRDVEAAQARVDSLTAAHRAASQDLASARAARQGGVATALKVRAPFAGEMASVSALAGATVTAGESLARLVRTDTLWLDVALPPAAAASIGQQGVRGIVLTDPRRPAIRLEQGLRLIAVAPEVSPLTGTVSVLFEAPQAAGLTLGTTLDARVLTATERSGIVVPASALVDDGGVTVVYLQLTGESFVRNAVEVLERQGEQVLVAGLKPGQRLVHRGGVAIRRSSLMDSGSAHGHVH